MFQIGHLSKFQRARAIGELMRGKKKAKITREMGVTKSCITKIAQKLAKVGPERAVSNIRGKRGRASLVFLMSRRSYWITGRRPSWLLPSSRRV